MKHDGPVTKLADAAITTQHLLVKIGSDADHIAAIAAVTDVPIGTCLDTPAAAENDVAVNVLGGNKGTQIMVASAAVTAGVRVFANNAGKVNALASTVNGTYFCVGVAITAAGADADEIEVASCVPYPVVVTGN